MIWAQAALAISQKQTKIEITKPNDMVLKPSSMQLPPFRLPTMTRNQLWQLQPLRQVTHRATAATLATSFEEVVHLLQQQRPIFWGVVWRLSWGLFWGLFWGLLWGRFLGDSLGGLFWSLFFQ